MNAPVHINRPSSSRFVAVARGRGCRQWVTIQSSKSKRLAMMSLARVMAKGIYFRGEILLTAGYYAPVSILSMRLK